MASIEKMNVYVITENKVALQTKDGRWFHQLFLPSINQNKPLQNKATVDMYWKSIRDVLFGKNKKTKLKVSKRKDIKFIAFPCKNNTVIAFVTGNDKSDALKEIYKLTVKEDKTTVNGANQLNKPLNNNSSESKLFELIKKELKPFGEVKKVNKIKFDDSARINIQITTKRTEEQMWNAINEVIKPIFSEKFDVEVEEVVTFDYKNTLLCPILVKKKSNKTQIKPLHKILHSDVINWISDHEQAFKDYCKIFNIDFNNFDPDNIKANITPNDTVGWLSGHKQLFKDFLTQYKLDEDIIKNEPADAYIEQDINPQDVLYCADINNIKWDTYDEETDTEGDPAELELPKGVSLYNIEAGSIEDAKDQIAEILSDGYGWLVNGFDIDELKIQTENNHNDFENETFYNEPVMAYEENKSESLAEVEHDFITGLINYEDAVDAIMELGEANTTSDAQAIVDGWELKNKKDTGKDEAHNFTIYLYNVKEPIEELKKWEHHFDYLYGDTNPGDYWDINVSDKTDENVVIKGKVSGVSEKDFKANIEEGLESYNVELDDIVWDEK